MNNFRRMLDALTPYEMPSLNMERWGPGADGGYVIPVEPFESATVLLTGGVCNDVEFEKVLAARNKTARMALFDHTIAKAPDDTPQAAKWHKLGLGPSEGCISLEEAAALAGLNANDRLVLKIDIEDAEWDLFETTPESFWSSASALVIELHSLDNPKEWERKSKLLETLNRSMLLIHIHGNNYSRPFLNEGELVPCTVEATYIHRRWIPSGIEPAVWKHKAPGSLDRRNNPEAVDIQFQFWNRNSIQYFLSHLSLMLLPWRLRKNIFVSLTSEKYRRKLRERAYPRTGN